MAKTKGKRRKPAPQRAAKRSKPLNRAAGRTLAAGLRLPVNPCLRDSPATKQPGAADGRITLWMTSTT